MPDLERASNDQLKALLKVVGSASAGDLEAARPVAALLPTSVAGFLLRKRASIVVCRNIVTDHEPALLNDHPRGRPPGLTCSPAAGSQKGQVEHQVQTIRGRFFQPRLRFANLEELNGWLEAEYLRWAATLKHPQQKDTTVAQAMEAERPALQPMPAQFDGFHETSHAVPGTCLISFDRNRYPVAARAVRCAV